MSLRRTFSVARGVNLVAAAAVLLGLCVAVGGTTTAGAANPSGTPLVFGVISSDTGTAGTTTDQSTTVKDWAHYVNTHGGINGHPVKVDYFDDTDSSAAAIQDAQTLVSGPCDCDRRREPDGCGVCERC